MIENGLVPLFFHTDVELGKKVLKAIIITIKLVVYLAVQKT